jgi:hypothetical protein
LCGGLDELLELFELLLIAVIVVLLVVLLLVIYFVLGCGSQGVAACWGGDEGVEDWGEVGVQEGGDLGLDGWRGVERLADEGVFWFWDLGLGLGLDELG